MWASGMRWIPYKGDFSPYVFKGVGVRKKREREGRGKERKILLNFDYFETLCKCQLSERIRREERGSIANVEEGKEKYRRERTDTEAIRRPDKQSDRQTNRHDSFWKGNSLALKLI